MPAGRADLLIYVQHLLGTGHLHRTAALARAAARAGLRTVLASGGAPVPGIAIAPARLIQLDPARAADETFRQLADPAGHPLDDAWRAARRAHLLDIFAATRPRILVTETFPFGRRLMRFELMPLVAAARAARPRPCVVSSVRDVLNAPRTAEKAQWIRATFEENFDLALVHGDPDLLPLDKSFPLAAKLAARLRYTGYVAAGADRAPMGGGARPDTAGAGEVVVSTGGGAVANDLIAAALGASALAPLSGARWRILVGHNVPEPTFRDFEERAAHDTLVERARADFPALLGRARLSISQGGYNTVVDVLRARVPALVVPFAAHDETEQTVRAQALVGRGLLSVLEERALSPESLAEAARAARAPNPEALAQIHLDGATISARILGGLI